MADDSDETTDWPRLADLLSEHDWTLEEFRARHPFATFDHADWDGQTVIDPKQLADGRD